MNPRPPKKRRQAGRRGVRLPAVARVPKPAPAKILRKDSSAISAEAMATAAAHLRDVAARIRAGDTSLLAALYPRGIGTTVSGLMPTPDQTVMMDAGTLCTYYLPGNRLEWWDAQIPDTGAITSRNDTVEEVFLCEFGRALATVVGADLPSPGMKKNMLSYQVIKWDGSEVSIWPNELPGLRFFVVTRWPYSVPVIAQMDVHTHDSGDQFVPANVLINAVQDGYQLDPNQIRPPLSLVFETPQRAVGLDYGYLPVQGGAGIPARSVELIAKDVNGNKIHSSFGASPVAFGNRLDPDKVDNRIGVRDRDGGIMSVELWFYRSQLDQDHRPDPNSPPIIEPQVIYRIWHEAFPPAAVKQDKHEIMRDGSGGDVPGAITLPPALPFHCDRAVAMMRGFKIEFLDNQPHKIDHLDVGIVRDEVDLDPQTRVRRITVVPRGEVGTRPDESPPHRVTVYYTLLAWDSAQADVFSNVVNPASPWLSDASGESSAEVADPCRAMARDLATMLPCGPAYAGLQYFKLAFQQERAQDVKQIALKAGDDLGAAQRTGAAGERVSWSVSATLEGGDDSAHLLQAGARVLTGGSLRIGEIPPRLFDPQTGQLQSVPFLEELKGSRPRADDPKHWDFTPDSIRKFGFALPIRADLAFVTLSRFDMEVAPPPMYKLTPFDEAVSRMVHAPVRELEVEVKGFNYDGALVDWEAGWGMSTEPSGADDRHFGLAWPVMLAGGVLRRDQILGHNLADLLVQDLVFDRADLGQTLMEPAQYGAIFNRGGASVLITDVREGGPNPGDFEFLMRVIGAAHDGVFSVHTLADIAPVRLRPGQALLISGTFRPVLEGGPTRSAWLEFATNEIPFRSPTSPTPLRVSVEGEANVPRSPFG